METTKPRSWNSIVTGLILFIMVAGVVLMVTFPVWLTPPNLASTVEMYLALLVLWLPLTIIFAVFGYRGPFALIIVTGVVGLIIGLALGGPNLSKGAISPKDCTSRETSPGQTEYTCKLTSSFGAAISQETLVFQGATGAGLMQKVSDTTVDEP